LAQSKLKAEKGKKVLDSISPMANFSSNPHFKFNWSANRLADPAGYSFTSSFQPTPNQSLIESIIGDILSTSNRFKTVSISNRTEGNRQLISSFVPNDSGSNQSPLVRLYPLFPNLDKIRHRQIVICGVGGVGGFTLQTLYFSGFTNLTVIDFDRFDLSNQNRQLGSYRVGELKVKVMEELFPGVRGIPLKLTPQQIPHLPILQRADLIVDAIDHLPTKGALILNYSDKVVSSMGAGRRRNPTKVEIGILAKTHTDPLARRLRKWIRERVSPDFSKRLLNKIEVVFSTEPPGAEGSFIGVTATFGMVLGTLALLKLEKTFH